MNCWKSVNLTKEFGINRLYIISLLIGLLAFIFLYVPISIMHKMYPVNESGMPLFLISLILLPMVHSLTHILPLIIMNKRVKLIYQAKNKIFPFITYYTDAYMTKKVFLIVALAPTLFITAPGVIASYFSAKFYVYFLLLTAIHIGMSFFDFLCIAHIVKAPKKSFVENGNDGFHILLHSGTKM